MLLTQHFQTPAVIPLEAVMYYFVHYNFFIILIIGMMLPVPKSRQSDAEFEFFIRFYLLTVSENHELNTFKSQPPCFFF